MPPAQIRIEAALDADFGRPSPPGFLGAPDDLIEIQHFCALLITPFRKAAELTAHIANIGEVDVATDDEACPIAMHFSAKRIGSQQQRIEISAFRLKQTDSVCRRNLLSEKWTLQNARNFDGCFFEGWFAGAQAFVSR